MKKQIKRNRKRAAMFGDRGHHPVVMNHAGKYVPYYQNLNNEVIIKVDSHNLG